MSSRTFRAPIRAVDLFCGAGGLTHGLQRAGVKVLAGIDIDPQCAYPYETNNAADFLQHDVGHVDSQLLADLFSDSDCRLLAGCAPCQPFSTYSRSRRGREHKNHWPLLLNFGRLVEEVQPELVTMENVPQVLDDSVFAGFLQCLDGYQTHWEVAECSILGIPQTRKRLVLFASKLGTAEIKLLPGTTGQRTVRDAIAGLPALEAGGRSEDDPLHMVSRLSPLNLERVRASLPGGTWRDWPPSLLADCHRKGTGSTYPSVYGRMEWDEPAPTITTQCFGYGNGRFGHPEQDRAISLREAAMLQTFPRNYAFVHESADIKFNKMGRWIGNAVPVRLGELIGQALVRHAEAPDEC